MGDDWGTIEGRLEDDWRTIGIGGDSLSACDPIILLLRRRRCLARDLGVSSKRNLSLCCIEISGFTSLSHLILLLHRNGLFLSTKPPPSSPPEPGGKVIRGSPRALALQANSRTGSDFNLRNESPWDTYKKHYECDLAGTVIVCVRSSDGRAARAIRQFSSMDCDKILKVLRSTNHKNVASVCDVVSDNSRVAYPRRFLEAVSRMREGASAHAFTAPTGIGRNQLPVDETL